jgi:RNA-directed DNA polymerase
MPGTPVLVKCADDFVVLCNAERDVYQVRARLVDRLDARGLLFNEEKTTVVRLDEGRLPAHSRTCTGPMPRPCCAD